MLSSQCKECGRHHTKHELQYLYIRSSASHLVPEVLLSIPPSQDTACTPGYCMPLSLSCLTSTSQCGAQSPTLRLHLGLARTENSVEPTPLRRKTEPTAALL